MQARVTLPEKQYKGYIFDLDGTLVDSMPTHYRAWRSALKHYGVPSDAFRWDEFVSHGGMSAPDIVRELNGRYGMDMDAEEVGSYKRDCYTRLIHDGQLPCIRETADLVRSLVERGIPCAIGTGSLMPGPLETLSAAGMQDLFSIIVTPADVQNGKPAPDIFLRCAELMGVAPADCVVFEDAEPGMRAARAAGMDLVVVGPCPRVDD